MNNNINQHSEDASIIIKIQCPDKKGIVSVLAQTIFEAGGNIITLREHVEANNDKQQNDIFFARIECVSKTSFEKIHKILSSKIDNVSIEIHNPYKKKIIVFVTQEYHCVGDLLLRNKYGGLNAEIVAVVSNRETLRDISERFNVPFFCVPYDKKMSREEHEDELQKVINTFEFEYIVLARYMRILSESFVNKYPSHIINIHHSFLPAFIGANPYKQAFNRGVKIIGATAHFVNKDLDEGPIITQQIFPIDHTYNNSKMKNAGRDVEKLTLSKALELVFDDRVFICKNKTIIL